MARPEGIAGASFPGFPRPYPHVPPEIVPSPVPQRPTVHPPVPTVWMPSDDLRSQVYEQLLARRTVFVDRPLDAETASLVAAQLMTLDAEGDPDDPPASPGRRDEAGSGAAADHGAEAGRSASGAGATARSTEGDAERPGRPGRPVTLVVNSPGGPLDAVSAVLDTIDLMRCPVDTTCIGQAVGTAAVIVAAGTGRRRAGLSAHFRLRLPDVELSGSPRRLDDEVAHHRRLHDLLIDRLAAATGQERRLVARDVERGRSFPAEEAVTYGLIDDLVTKTP